MIAIVSPSKAKDFESVQPCTKTFLPAFLLDAEYLISKIAQVDRQSLGKLFKTSPALTREIVDQIVSWESAKEKQALFAYAGVFYKSLDAISLTPSQIDFCNNHLRIISGLYGLLRPLDAIKPHRLDMGTALKTTEGKNLYRFWGERITQHLNQSLKEISSDTLINLASQEFFDVIDKRKIKARIITISFKKKINDTYTSSSYDSKLARGMMARYMIQNAITEPEMLMGFEMVNYMFNPRLSTSDDWVFTK